MTNPPGSGRGGGGLERIEERGAVGLRTVSPPPALHLVSERTRQFEQGKCQVDRTRLYR